MLMLAIGIGMTSRFRFLKLPVELQLAVLDEIMEANPGEYRSQLSVDGKRTLLI